ncbi:hypothetical protein [Sphingomonas alpina]|uniref:VWFD domain-containing protein n=1 Tax=Sphingomonas alpina TaxID=653931 RepID=A0A7H0LLZ6_9SPHN|nr:hypothetical protein [Sphingomonas alpina]QNQ10699.1 hypothetical protein H3Z74_05740 [Sphingomonas alpina]
MNLVSSKLIKGIVATATIGLFAMSGASQAPTNDVEPIAYIGHGSFFDSDGNQIVPTVEFVARAQDYYRDKLMASLDGKAREGFAEFERRFKAEMAQVDVKQSPQAELIVRQASLDWLVANAPRVRADGRTIGKINALKYRLTFTLPAKGDRKSLPELKMFDLNPELAKRLDLPDFKPGGGAVFLSTTNKGQAYIDECVANGVPIPPSIGVLDPAGTAGWKSQGFIPIPDQFIGQNNGPSPAELRTFESPQGMCMALPRYTTPGKTTVGLDGVICLSKTTSKVCIWDNQMNGVGFSFPAGTQIPIGKPNLAVNPAGLYQAGGFELENGTGGVCTDCHAGENPYIIHPEVTIAPGKTMEDLGITLPTFAPNRYDPIVPASWPQNNLSHAQPLVPDVCVGCHVQGNAGRFPHLSTQYNGNSGYCKTILKQAVEKTMPEFNGGGELSNPAVATFRAFCGTDATSGPSDRGDPHLTTTNNINYDFQAAGEFTALRNSDTGFELQTRQTPVTTTFIPGANPYTGLASCVSLNTAVAARIGKHRISFQPSAGRPASAERMQLRIDGRAVAIPANGLSLGSGNLIARAAAGGGIDVKLSDGTRLIVTPNYWASQGYWYLDVEVVNTPAREGTMGHIPATSWLPLAPSGASFGPAPASLAARHALLNVKFANAWRVTAASSLFDYAAGTSTLSFTDRGWPPKPGTACVSAKPMPGIPNKRPVEGMKPEVAQRLCKVIEDKTAYANCVFDLTVTGNAGMLDGYKRTLALRKLAL